MLLPPRYAEGIWTPTIRGSSTAGTYETVSNQSKWTRIGNRVFLDMDIQLASSITGGGTGNIQFLGVPYNKIDSYQSLGSVMVVGFDWATTSDYLVIGWQGSSTSNVLTIYEVTDNSGWTACLISGASVNDRFLGSISYITHDNF